MTSSLPTRPFPAQPTPPEGLETVRREAGRRRRRKLAVAGGGAGAFAVVAAVVLSSAGAGLAVLRPAPPAGPGVVQPAPVPTGQVTGAVVPPRRHHPADGRQRSVPGSNTGSDRVRGHAVARVPEATDAVPPPGGHVSRAQPQLVRTQSTYTGEPRVCSGSTYGGSDGVQYGVDWCVAGTATRTSGGVRLSVQVCRDSAGGSGTLTFDGTREVNLAVRQGNRTVWDWAKLHPGGTGTHSLSADGNGCWTWSVVWPDIAQDGSSAGRGSFTFVGTSTASELRGSPQETATFSY
jgi:hypothetical protein